MAQQSGAVITQSSAGIQTQVTGLLVLNNFKEEHPQALKKLIEGYNLAVERIAAAPREDVNRWLVQYAGAPQEIAGQIVLPRYRKAQIPQAADLQQAVNWLVRKEALPQDFSLAASQMIDTTFIPR